MNDIMLFDGRSYRLFTKINDTIASDLTKAKFIIYSVF